MENVADALKMAAAVLIFVLALSIIMLSFSNVRQSVDTILSYRDRETVYIDGNFYYTNAKNTLERTVGLETIIPTIYRAYLENYKVVFEGLDKPIYTIIQNDGSEIKKYSLDLETNIGTQYVNVVLSNDNQKQEFLDAILYKKNYTYSDFKAKYSVRIDDNGLYKQLSEKLSQGYQIKEYLGVYYQDDNPDVPNVNKTEKRIITYKIVHE